jgi:TolA-binding protein|tara:strand:- start:29 stop:1072 length:1044 start_codon:yes stop_codon:yes gene_type:complete
MRFGYLLLALFFLSQSPSYSQNHNAIEVDLERVKKDIIDLQKFVYQNNNLDLSDQSISSSEIENLNKLLLSLEEKLISFEIQLSDMKEDIKSLYQLYTSSQSNNDIKLETTKDLNIEESSSKIVSEKNNNDQILGQMSISSIEADLSDLESDADTNLLIEEDDNEQVIGELSITSLEEQKIIILEPTDEQLDTLNDLDQLLEQREIELNKPIIDVAKQMQIAKQSLASLENQKAIESLILIVESDTDNLDILAETYYLLGRTYFIEGQIIESVKYFGIRHRDLTDISKFKSDNYFWLGKSLFSIGDQENGCLIMEDLIFSNSYLDKPEIIESAKELQLNKDCGLIID